MVRSLRSRVGSGHHGLVGLVVVLWIAFVVVAIDTGFITSLFAPGGEIVSAHMGNTEQLQTGDPVRINGVDVGTVQSMSLDPGGRTATVRMMIEKAGQPIYANARVTLRWRTALGGSYAIDLTRGYPSAGVLGSASIPVTHTSDQVETDDVLSFDQGGAKRGIHVMLAQLPVALSNPQAPATALGSLAAVSPNLATALSSVQGRYERDLAPLVATTAQTMRALDTPVTTARDVVQGAAATLNVTALHHTDIRSTINQLAAVQPSVLTTLAGLNGTLTLADPLISRLQAPAQEVAPTLANLKPTVVVASKLLTRARPLLQSLRPAVTSLGSAATAGQPLLTGLTPSIDRLAQTILPSLAQTDPVTKLPTYEMIGPVLASLDGAASTFDGQGHLFRFPALAGERALSDDLPCATYITDPESPALIECEALSQALSRYSNYVGQLGRTK